MRVSGRIGTPPESNQIDRAGDFSETATTDGRRIDIVRIPRSKQRGQPPRAEFKAFWLASDAVLRRAAFDLGADVEITSAGEGTSERDGESGVRIPST